MGCEFGTNCLETLDYGNQDSVSYTYDDQGRLILEVYEDGETVRYAYDNSGNLATVTDSETGVVTTYYYDLLNRQSGYRETGASLNHSVIYLYDAKNNLSSMTETIDEVTKTYTYTYNEFNRLTSMTVDGITVEYTYDDFGRLTQQVTKQGETVILTEPVTYSPGSGDNTTSGQVSSHNCYTYTYDGNGNILSVSDGTNTTSYVYDSANQLIRENNQAQGFTHTWTYDAAGNILSRTEYAYTTAESLEGVPSTKSVSYSYGDTEWGDLLTAYNGNAITYDNIGNPLSDGTWTYTWKHGRQLTSMTKGSVTWTYTYDAGGMRTGRSPGNAQSTYTYVYNGDKLTRMTVDGYTFRFTYDANGTPLTLSMDSTVYYYKTNLQGDVIGILRSDGTQVVTYSYDAWGNMTYSAAEQIVEYNPLTYRGYVYDFETGLYYLQSRYYNPKIGRFINADALVSTGHGLLGNNMLAYSNNNPVVLYDPNGLWTIGLSIGANLTCLFGFSISIGIYMDEDFNFDFQWSYSVAGTEDTTTVGAFDVGVGVSLQVTDRESVEDLYGPAICVGASGGPGWYVGGDAISFMDGGDFANSDINGFQMTAGIGIGVDVHVALTNTKPVGSKPNSQGNQANGSENTAPPIQYATGAVHTNYILRDIFN